MNQEIKFSICIPNYNYANYIGKTIDSVLGQTYSNFEILVADNASTDKSVEVINGYDDPRIKLIQNNINVGFAPNLDKASDLASGDYMLMLSSDDLMHERALEVYAEQISKYDGLNKPLVLCSSMVRIDENDNVFKDLNGFALTQQIVDHIAKARSVNWEQINVFDGHEILTYALSDNFAIVGRFLSLCYARTLYEKVEGYRSGMTIMPDAHFSHKLMTENPLLVVVPENLFYYRIHSANNYSAIYKHPKLAIDAYQMTQLYRDDFLLGTGLSNEDIKNNFVHYFGVKSVISSCLYGRVWYSFRLWHLVWSVYPELYRMKIIAWIFPFFSLLIYPLRIVIRVLRNYMNGQKKNTINQ